MNIEDFFIEKYKALEEKNHELAAELLKHMNREKGFDVFPADNNLHLVKVTHIKSWEMDSGFFKGKTSQELEELKSRINGAFEWSVGYSKAITVEEQIFPFSFYVKMPAKNIRYAVHEDGSIVRLYDIDNQSLYEWCNAEFLDELKEMAKQKLLEEMDKRIERLRKEEEKE